MASHAEGLRLLSEVLVHLAKAKQTADEMAGANNYGDEFQRCATVARVALNDAFDTSKDALGALRKHEQDLLTTQLTQVPMFGEGAGEPLSGTPVLFGDPPPPAAASVTVPPPDDSDADSAAHPVPTSKRTRKRKTTDPAN